MRVLSPILNRVIYPVLGKAGYLRSRASTAVVTYHGVLPKDYKSPDVFLDDTLISVDGFRTQLRLLKRDYDVISPQQFRGWIDGKEPLPNRAVLLTCDDGLLNNLTVMLPILQEEKLQCLFFVTGDVVGDEPAMLWYIELYLMVRVAPAGAAFEWHGVHVPALQPERRRRAQWLELMHQLSRLDAEQRAEFLSDAVPRWGLDSEWKKRYIADSSQQQRFQLLDRAQVRQLTEAGMSIGAHSLSHPVLSQQSEESARKEIVESRRELEQVIAGEVWALAYPYGNPATVGERELRLAQEAGYSCAFMNVPGNLNLALRFSFPRVHITAEMSSGVFEANVSGFHEALRKRLRQTQ